MERKGNEIKKLILMFQKHLKTFAIINFILISLELINCTAFVFTPSSWLTFPFMADKFDVKTSF